jgi:hypothetical protein
MVCNKKFMPLKKPVPSTHRDEMSVALKPGVMVISHRGTENDEA